MSSKKTPTKKFDFVEVFAIIVVAAIVLIPVHAIVMAQMNSQTQVTGVTVINPPQKRQPNIIVVQTDDQDMRSIDAQLPNGTYAMQNVRDEMIVKGTRFTNSFVSYSLCCPSRATLLTGQYAHNHGVLGNVLPEGGYFKMNHTNTLPMWLQSAGYHTAHFGKYLNDYKAQQQGSNPPLPPGWDKWFTVSSYPMTYYNYSIFDGSTVTTYGNQPADYLTDVLTNQAVSYLTQKPYNNKPFFMLLDYFGPHKDNTTAQSDVEPAPRHMGMMNGAPLPQYPNFNETDVSDKPQLVAGFSTLTTNDINALTEHYRRRIESLISVDEGFAAVINTLKQTGQYDNTIIFFVGDNGYHLGEHRILAGKLFPYEESIRVPFMMRGPGIPQGQTIDALVTNVDYSPTILSLSKAKAGLPQDGRNLIPLIKNPTIAWRSDFVVENPIGMHYSGLRTKDTSTGSEYLYVEYDYDSDNVVDEKELYAMTPDLCMTTGDPYQLESQHNNSCYAPLIQQFGQRLAQLKVCAGSNCQA